MTQNRWSAQPVSTWGKLRLLLVKLDQLLNFAVCYKDEWRYVTPGTGAVKHVLIDAVGAHVIFVEVGGVAPDVQIDNPTNGSPGQELEIIIWWNADGGGTLAWGSDYRLAGAFTLPAEPKIRSITFTKRPLTVGGAWGEKCRTMADQDQ